MPPAIPEDGSSSESEILPKKKNQKPIDEEDAEEEEEADEEDEEEEDAEPGSDQEYVVEKIMNHAFDPETGECKYHVKWLGYEAKKDTTWEPEDNLSSAQDALAEYFKGIGGRPVPGESRPKKSRKRSSTAVDSPAGKARKGKRGKTSEDGTPDIPPAKKDELPKGSWEGIVNFVETIEEAPDPGAKGEMRRMVYLMWNDGRRTCHPLNVIRQKCPQRLIDYLEGHLVFKAVSDDGMDLDAKKENGL